MIMKAFRRSAQTVKLFMIMKVGVAGGGDHGWVRAAGVRFTQAPGHEPCGTVAVFEGLYRNRWDLIQPS